MEYQALYRKYRPQNFNEVAGQKIALKILQNAIIYKKISHAYLFYGPRGTGKTSLAKIFARTVNCINNDSGIQCEKCSNCIVSKEKECIDIVEIDAASNNGVDEIRELKNKVSFVPNELKYKVYIIDEVHMLSIGAFNALLKTLEEPPEHIIFILATTELNKVPSTIISRCQTIEFKKITEQENVDKLKEIATKENINITDNALKEIARYSNGGLRDSIGLLEKAISYCNNEITEDIVKEISGNISTRELENFIDLYEKKDSEKIIKLINNYYNEGIDLIKVVNDIITYEASQMIDTKNYNKNKCSIIKEFDDISNYMKKSDNPKIIFEVSILNLLSNNNQTDTTNQTEYNKVFEEKNDNNDNIEIKKQENQNKENNIDDNELKKIRISNTLCNPKKEIILEIRNKWNEIKNLAFDQKYGNISRILSSDTIPVAASETNIIIISKMNGLAEQINSDIISVESVFLKIFNKNFKVICISEKEWSDNIEKYKKDKTQFKYVNENQNTPKRKMTLMEKAQELFGD